MQHLSRSGIRLPLVHLYGLRRDDPPPPATARKGIGRAKEHCARTGCFRLRQLLMERKTATRRYYTRGSSCDIVALQQKETPVLTVEVARMQGRRLLVDARWRSAFTRSREEGGGLHSARRRDSAQGFTAQPLAVTKTKFSVTSAPLKPQHRAHGASLRPLC